MHGINSYLFYNHAEQNEDRHVDPNERKLSTGNERSKIK